MNVAAQAAPLERRDTVLIGLCAFFLAIFFVGGTCSEDVLKVYVGALRMAEGHLPYRDFMPQYVPLPHLLAAPFFAVLPPGLAALTVGGLENVLASLLVSVAVAHITGDRCSAVAAGLLTALWNLQVGGFYFDQVAYWFVFAAFLRTLFRPVDTPPGVAEGVLLACAALSKQSVGGLACLAFAITVLWFRGWRHLVAPKLVLGFIVPLMAAWGYLLCVDGTAAFMEQAIYRSVDFAVWQKRPSRLLTDFAMPWNIDILAAIRAPHWGQLSFYPWVLSIYVSYVLVFVAWHRRRLPKRLAFAYAAVLISTIWSEATPGRLYAHLSFGAPMILALTVHLAALRWPSVPSWLRGLVFFLFGAIALVQGARNGYMDAGRASPLNPDATWPLRFDARQVAAIEAARVMDDSAGPIALFGDLHLISIPLALRRAPIDPLLFYENVTMIPRDAAKRREWETRLVSTYEARHPRFIVTGFERPPMKVGNSLESLERFPLIQAYVERNFAPALTSIDGVEVRERSRAGADR